MQRHRISGLGLIEVMITMLIGIVISAIVYRQIEVASVFFHKSKQHIIARQSLLITESILRNSLHSAGYFGCHSLNHIKVKNHVANINKIMLTDSTPYGLSAVHAEPSTQFPNLPINERKVGSDILITRSLSTDSVNLTQPMTTTSSPLQLETTVGLKKKTIVAIYDCIDTELFTITSLRKNTIQPNKALSKRYQTHSEVAKLHVDAFYLRKSKHKTHQFNLFERDEAGQSEELLEHVNDFTVSLSNRSKPDVFIPTQAFHQWNIIAKVKIRINYGPDNQVMSIISNVGRQND
jgi:hypothetical protein